MWDKSRPTRRPTASVSLISLISLRTVLCTRYCPVLAVEKCFKHSAVILPGLLGSQHCHPPSPISYTLQTICSPPSLNFPFSFPISLPHTPFALPPSYVAFSHHIPSLTFFFHIEDNHILLFFPFGTMSVPTVENIYSISLLFWPSHFMVFGFLFFSLFYPTNLHALSPFSPFPIHLPHLSSKCVFPLTLRIHVPLFLVFLFFSHVDSSILPYSPLGKF
jgi:hypothetical protein